MSFFEELKRRNVFRVGAAYAVGAWVVLQLLDVLGDILELPAWGGRLILALLIIGFFVALIVAWAYELTPEGVKREKDVDRSASITRETGKRLNLVIIVLMAVAIGYLLFDKFYLAQRMAAPATDGTAQAVEPVAPPPPGAEPDAAPAAISRQSIAVLPFDNRSRLEEDEFFVEGVHDDLLTNLSRIGSLKVISRTSVSRYRDSDKSIPEIARELGVATVMEGAVQRAGSTVRINVQLIDAQTDEHLWAEIFDRELTADNLFDIQSEISGEIAKALKATLSPEEQRRLGERPTDNLAAYNAYLRGRQLMARRTSTDLDQAAAEFQRAVELDPEFALAWVGIGETAMLQIQYSDLDPVVSMERRKMATDRALAIDDQLGEAYLGRAGLLSYNEQYEEAEAAYRKAIELSPGYAPAYHWYANMLMQFPHRLAEAVQLLEKALELDPLSSITRNSLAASSIDLGRFEEADRQLDRLLELDPGFVQALTVKARVAAQQGRKDQELAWLQRAIEADPGRMSTYFDLAWVYMDLGYVEPLADIRQSLVEINEQHPWIGVIDAVTAMYSGNMDGALEGMRWAYEAFGRPAFFLRVIGFTNLLKGDYAAAREAFRTGAPGFFDPETLQTAIELSPADACGVGMSLLRSGEEELGQHVLQASADYLQNELPRYIDHADRYDVETCLLELGQVETALATIETRIADGHLSQWWLLRRWPAYEPLRGDPRFEAVVRRAEEEMAAQRARVIEAETASL